MKTTLIQYPHYTLRIQTRSDADLATPDPDYGPNEFLRDFWAMGSQVKAPLTPRSGEDYRLAMSFLRKFSTLPSSPSPSQRAREYIRAFWYRHSDAYYTGEYPHALRLFASAFERIKQEVDA